MKKLIVILFSISLMNCGVKKDLVTANETNQVLTKKVAELEDVIKNNSEYVKLIGFRVKELEFSNEECEKRIKKKEDYFEEFKKQVPSNILTEIKMRELKKDEERIVQLKRNTEDEVFSVTEETPKFPQGEDSLYRFLNNNIDYPIMAFNNGIQGKVFIQFIVEKDGSLSDIQVARGISEDCDKEAIRIIKKMPKWIPGKNRGKEVRVKYYLPVNFSLKNVK